MEVNVVISYELLFDLFVSIIFKHLQFERHNICSDLTLGRSADIDRMYFRGGFY